MPKAQNPNLQVLETAVRLLGPLADDMVFLGGCATGLLLTDAAAPPIRATQDVDVITEVASLADYYRLSAQLRERGFNEDHRNDAPVCRWVNDGVVLDIMPTSPAVLGFGNEWYQPALEAAVAVDLPSGRRIRIVTAPYFLATKIAAFDGRGQGDYVMSHDMEDIVAVVDGRPQIVDEIKRADQALRRHVTARFAAFLRDPDFLAALPGHLPGDAANQARAPVVLDRVAAMAEGR
jgi:predicted nucleotidyltransferase